MMHGTARESACDVHCSGSVYMMQGTASDSVCDVHCIGSVYSVHAGPWSMQHAPCSFLSVPAPFLRKASAPFLSEKKQIN